MDGLQNATVHTFGDFVNFVQLVGADDESCGITITNLTNISKEANHIKVRDHRKNGVDNLRNNSVKVVKEVSVLGHMRILKRIKALLFKIFSNLRIFGTIHTEIQVEGLQSLILILNNLVVKISGGKAQSFINDIIECGSTASVRKHFHIILPPYRIRALRRGIPAHTRKRCKQR